MNLKNIVLICITFLFTACTSGVIPTDESTKVILHSQTPVTISTSSIHSTKTRADEVPDKYTFKEGDQIGVTMIVDNQPAVTNVPFTLTAGKWVAEEDIYYPDHGKKATFSFYFPYQKDFLVQDDLKGYLQLSSNQKDLGQLEHFSTCQLKDVTETEEALKVDLKLQLVKIFFQIQSGADYTLEELQSANLELTNCFTHGVYDFFAMNFNDFYGLDNLYPAGDWVIDADANVIKGKYCLIFPNTETNMTEAVYIGGQKFSATVPTKTQSGESIQSGNAYTFRLTPNNSNRTYSHSSISVEISLTSWTYHDTEDVSTNTHTATNGLVVKDLDFSSSKILSMMHEEQEVAVLTRELKVDKITSTAEIQIKVYPKKDNVVDWESGIVLSKDGIPEEATVYLASDNTLSTSYKNNGQSIYTEPKVLLDKRNGHTYPLVRVGNLTWTAENAHERMTIDYTPLEKVSVIRANSLNPLYTTSTDSESNVHYFYPSATLANYRMSPAGWRLPTQADIVELTKTFNNPEYLLASSTADDTANKTGLNLIDCGYIEEAEHKCKNSFAALWAQESNDFLIFTLEPKPTSGYGYHLYSEKSEVLDVTTSAVPVRWVAE